MGFKAPNLDPAYHVIRDTGFEIMNNRNDGYTQSYCKSELFKLKCYLEDMYQTLPKFSNESEWEQERILQVLKRKNK